MLIQNFSKQKFSEIIETWVFLVKKSRKVEGTKCMKGFKTKQKNGNFEKLPFREKNALL